MSGNRSNRRSGQPSLTSDLSSEIISVRLNSKRFRCTICKKLFSSKHCLREHSYKHMNLKPYRCSVCFKELRHASQFTLHKLSHKAINILVLPRLDELEKRSAAEGTLNENINEKLQLPLICGPSLCSLPLFQSIFTL